MTQPETPDIAERFVRLVQQGIGAGDESVIEEVVDPSCREHQRGNADGIEGAKAVARVLHTWFDDFSLTVEDLAVSGDTVWTRNTARGVNVRPVMGYGPTNAPVEVVVFDAGRFVGGKMVDHWGVPDQLGLLLQVGFRPGQAHRD